MKTVLLAAGMAGGAAFALRRLPRHTAALHKHCSRCGCDDHEQANDRR